MSFAFSARLRACAVALALVGTSCLALAGKASAEHFKVATAAELESAVNEANTTFAATANTVELTSTVPYTLSAPLIFTNTSGPQELVGLPTAEPGATIGASLPTGDVAITPGVDVIVKRLNLASGFTDPAIVDLPGGHVDVTSSEITSGAGAGGIDVKQRATAEVHNSTIGEGGLGVVDEGEASFFNATIAYNEIGIYLPPGKEGQFSLTNTIVAENEVSGDCKGGTATASEFSLDSDGSCGVGALSKVNPKLEPVFKKPEPPLSFDGGPTRIFSLKPGSPAIDAVPPPDCPATDQRGQPRPDQPATPCDIGADEYNPTPPVWTVPPSLSVEQNVATGAVVNYAASASSTDDLNRIAQCTPASGTVFGFGATTVNCFAVDGHEATATASFEVTVTEDDSTPEIEVPASIKVKSEGAGGAKVSYKEPTAKDPDGDPIVFESCSRHSGETFSNGTTTVACEATDLQGRSATKSFTVSVYLPVSIVLHLELIEFPVLPGPGPSELITVDASGRAGAVVSYGVTGSDNVDGAVAVRCAPASGSTFAIGKTTVSCSAADSAGDVTSVSFVVTVRGAHEQLAALEKAVGGSLTSSPLLRGRLLFDLRATDFFRPGGGLPIESLACFTLGAFINTVSESSNPGPINTVLATEWSASGKRIGAVIGCPVAPRAG